MKPFIERLAEFLESREPVLHDRPELMFQLRIRFRMRYSLGSLMRKQYPGSPEDALEQARAWMGNIPDDVPLIELEAQEERLIAGLVEAGEIRIEGETECCHKSQSPC